MTDFGITLAAAAAVMALAGSEWGPADGGGRSVRFGVSDVSGSGGCNNFGGPYEQKDGAIRIGPLMATMMACTDEAVMERERQWFQMLEYAREIEASHTVLVLKDASGTVLAKLQRRDWD